NMIETLIDNQYNFLHLHKGSQVWMNSIQCFLDQSAKFLHLRLMEGGRKFLSTLLAVLDQGEIERDFRFTDSRGAAETEWVCSTSGEIMQAPRAENLLRVAASLGNADRAEKWIAGLSPERKKMSKMLARRLLHSRIVVFVDDLDRGQENVILQILSGVNLVLAVGKINVIFGMDKRMMEGRGLSGGKIVNA
ncbi:hypothetical protein SUGI_0439590, partial [Cryptomeria japonica]